MKKEEVKATEQRLYTHPTPHASDFSTPAQPAWHEEFLVLPFVV